MNEFEVSKNITEPKNESNYKAGDLYLKLLGSPNKTIDDILFLKTPIDQYNKEIYLKAKTLFNSRERIFKKLSNKGIIKNDDYKESIAE